MFLISGCYCFNGATSTPPNVRYLEGSKSSAECDDWGGKGKSFQVNGYIGFPNSHALKKDYKQRFSPSNSSDYKLKTIGQFGFRVEKYVRSFVIPYRVLGIGIDYSQGFQEVSYTLNTSKSSHNIHNHRAMLSLNHMTLVKGNFIGYLTLQGGVNQIIHRYSNELPLIEKQKIIEPIDFAYRVGYGFQYYLKGAWGLAIEGGYGDGAYFKAGLFWWFY